jgi:hypothetical protein
MPPGLGGQQTEVLASDVIEGVTEGLVPSCSLNLSDYLVESRHGAERSRLLDGNPSGRPCDPILANR